MTVTLQFPVSPAAGAAFPPRGAKDPEPSSAAVTLGGFDRLDYEGWKPKTQGRMSWVADPLDASRTVCRMEVRGTDVADQFGGCRTSMWRNADNKHGTESWVSFGFLLPTGFVWPSTWLLLYQMFSSGGNPAQALELRPAPSKSGPRDHLWWKCQTAPSSGKSFFPLAPATTGVWHRIVTNTRYSSSMADGFCRVWHSLASQPNTNLNPLVDFKGKTLYDTQPGRENSMLYRDPGPASEVQVMLVDSFLRGTSAADVI